MFLFWIVAAILSAAVAALILTRAAAARASAGASGPLFADPGAALHRRQLAEIDDLADRGLLAEGERRGAHAEAARRLLADADRTAAPWNEAPAVRPAVLAAAIAAPAAALGLYLTLGAPGLGDQPYAKRLATWQSADLAQLPPPELAAVLRSAVKSRPNDPDGLRFLALAEGAAENGPAAVRALTRAVALAPERTDLWRLLGEAQVYSASGDVPAEAQASFRQVLAREPSDVTARFYLARAAVTAGEPTGLPQLRGLAAELAADDPRRAAALAAIADAERASAPAFAPDQMSAIRGMVAGLAARLETAPDDPEGWVRLVRAYAVLGDQARRDAALAAAQTRYAGRAEVLTALTEAASAESLDARNGR